MFKFRQDRIDTNRRLEIQAFYDGAHDLNPETGTSQIDAQFGKEAAELEGTSIKRQRAIEAQVEHFEKTVPECEREQDLLKERMGSEGPQLVVPALVGAAGVAALFAETIMLAPSLDAIGISNPTLQSVAAFGLSAFTATIFHLALDSLSGSRWSKIFQYIWRVLGIWGMFSMIAWGLMRGHQVAFAADISQNPLGQFLNGYPILAGIFYVFVTLGAPLSAAGALAYSSAHIRDGLRFHAAKRKLAQIAKQLPILKKALEAEGESLKQGLRAIGEKCKQWKQAYLLFHERGRKRGALKPPFWILLLKATVAAVATLIVIGFVAFAYPLLFLLPVVVFIAVFLYFRHERNHPTPAQFFAHEYVSYRNAGREPNAGGN
jgi:hypothetical protein